MAEVLITYQTELKRVKSDLPNILRQILIEKKEEVISILQNTQLAKGLDSKGNIIGRYSPATQKISESRDREPRQPKIAGAPFNFQDTGGLFDDMFLLFEDKKSYSLFSKDDKAKMLEEEYGDIYTLTNENNEHINQVILLPNAWEEIIRRFGNI